MGSSPGGGIQPIFLKITSKGKKTEKDAHILICNCFSESQNGYSTKTTLNGGKG